MSLDPAEASAFELIAAEIATVTPVDPMTRVVRMECPGCPFLKMRHHRKLLWEPQPVENDLLFNFTVGNDRSTLQVNGVQFYPPLLNFFPSPISAPQLRAEEQALNTHKLLHSCRGRRVTVSGYSWRFPAIVSQQGGEIIPITFHVDAIEGIDIAVPIISVKALRAADGSLLILDAIVDRDTPKDSISGLCNNPFCRMLEAAKPRMEGLKNKLKKGCRKIKLLLPHVKPAENVHIQELKPTLPEPKQAIVQPTPVQATQEATTETATPHTRPRPQRCQRFRSFFQSLLQGVKFILLPVLIGIGVGFIVYMFGMALGLFIASLWITIRRRYGRGTYSAVPQHREAGFTDDDDLDVDVAKIGLLASGSDRKSVV